MSDKTYLKDVSEEYQNYKEDISIQSRAKIDSLVKQYLEIGE